MNPSRLLPATLLVASLALALPLPTADASHDCVLGPGDSVCVIACGQGGIVSAEVTNGGAGGASISFRCGDAEGSCTAPAGGACATDPGFNFSPDSPGVCVLDDHDDPNAADNPLAPAHADATGTCRIEHSDPECFGQSVHTYGLGGQHGWRSQSATMHQSQSSVHVYDTNTNDCDGDGTGTDFDGDYDLGVGGGFFGHGPWANEPLCRYGLNTHGGNVAVQDLVFGSGIHFIVGEDDQDGPVILRDPDTNEVVGCQTDGTIAPRIDADDCLSPLYLGAGSTCGTGGGDGGYWVVLVGTSLTDDPLGLANNPPTVGTITAY